MISTILSYSSLDLRFLKKNLEQVSKFSDDIIITICDHFFKGEPEDFEKLKQSKEIINQFNNIKVKVFPWSGNYTDNYYHNLGRKIGTDAAKNDWLFFIDGDEIVDDEFLPWVKNAIKTDVAYILTSYWYFRHPTYQAKTNEAQGLLIRKEKCNWDLYSKYERSQAFNFTNVIDGVNRKVLSYNNKPMIHHYSWVRTKEEMIKKVKNWGHCNDKDWVSLVEEEFSRPFNGTDFVHRYEYEIVDNIFNIDI